MADTQAWLASMRGTNLDALLIDAPVRTQVFLSDRDPSLNEIVLLPVAPLAGVSLSTVLSEAAAVNATRTALSRIADSKITFHVGFLNREDANITLKRNAGIFMNAPRSAAVSYLLLLRDERPSDLLGLPITYTAFEPTHVKTLVIHELGHLTDRVVADNWLTPVEEDWIHSWALTYAHTVNQQRKLGFSLPAAKDLRALHSMVVDDADTDGAIYQAQPSLLGFIEDFFNEAEILINYYLTVKRELRQHALEDAYREGLGLPRKYPKIFLNDGRRDRAAEWFAYVEMTRQWGIDSYHTQISSAWIDYAQFIRDHLHELLPEVHVDPDSSRYYDLNLRARDLGTMLTCK